VVEYLPDALSSSLSTTKKKEERKERKEGRRGEGKKKKEGRKEGRKKEKEDFIISGVGQCPSCVSLRSDQGMSTLCVFSTVPNSRDLGNQSCQVHRTIKKERQRKKEITVNPSCRWILYLWIQQISA
jgi:hypothetical protein